MVASSLGWLAGSVAQIFWYELLSEVRFPGAGLLVESLPWAFLGTGQALALLAVGLHSFAFSAPRALAWALVSAAGGASTEAAVVLTTRPFYDALRGAMGEYALNAVQLAILAAALYALPTGLVLIRTVRPTAAGGAQAGGTA